MEVEFVEETEALYRAYKQFKSCDPGDMFQNGMWPLYDSVARVAYTKEACIEQIKKHISETQGYKTKDRFVPIENPHKYLIVKVGDVVSEFNVL